MNRNHVKAWDQTTLGQMVTLQRGFDITKKEQEDGPYVVISSSGPASRHCEYKVNGPGVVIGRKGTLGTVFYSELPFWPHDTTLWVKDFHGNDPRFAYYFLKTLRLEQYDCGASNPTINRNHIHILPVRCPTPTTRRKIAAILSAYDDLIENNTRRIRILEAMAQALYREWFVHFRFPGHEKVKMVEWAAGRVPAGWEVKRLGEVITLARDGISPGEFEDEVFAHYSIPAFDNGCMPALDEGRSIKSNKYAITARVILLSKLNPRIPRVWMPFPENAKRSVASTEFLVMAPKPPLTREFVFGVLKSDEFQAEFSGRSIGTSTSHQRVKPDDVLNMDTIVPTVPIVDTYSNAVDPMLRLAHKLRLKNATLRRTRDLLLPKLISGEVDVSGMEIDVRV